VQYAGKSTLEGLNARDAHHASSRPEQREPHARYARRFWLRVARQSLARARKWRADFGGPLHAWALAEYLENLVDAHNCREFAHEIGRSA
jgi:hypothetical protein